MVHDFNRAIQACTTAQAKCILIARILSENLGMAVTSIAAVSRVDKAIVSRLLNLNHPEGGSEKTYQRLRSALTKKLATVRILGTCAYPRQFTDDETTSIKLELATVMHHGQEAFHVSLPEGVAAAWGTTLESPRHEAITNGHHKLADAINHSGFNTFCGFHIILDQNIDDDGYNRLAHELEEFVSFLRNRSGENRGDSNPQSPKRSKPF